MAGIFSAERAINLAQLHGGVGTTHPPDVHLAAHLLQVFRHRFGGPNILNDKTLDIFLFDEVMSQHGNHQIRGDEVAVLIDEHHAVGVTIEDHTDVGLGFTHLFLQRDNIFRFQRIRLVVREGAVQRVEQVERLVPEDLLDEDRSHAVGAVHHQVQVVYIIMILRLELQVFLLYGVIDNLAFGVSDDHFFVQHFLFQFPETGVEAHGQRILSGDLQPVVFFRVMGRGNHHRCLESMLGREVINHRGGGEPHVIYIRARVGDAACEGVEHIVGGQPHIPANQHLVGM